MLSRIGGLRNVRLQPRRNFNPGPPTNMDYVPVPCQVHRAQFLNMKTEFTN